MKYLLAALLSAGMLVLAVLGEDFQWPVAWVFGLWTGYFVWTDHE